ncbi:hypothetical protein Pan153_44950 [Gimesia panareensis]|uniref:Uncharacterized protein n=1 Tax=Gimesia panareensis TaxID=2527978 RepID=A0A518FU08_9PLAN|nr:hypothetical protein Pan153_44950 [Gimesia panareensis]
MSSTKTSSIRSSTSSLQLQTDAQRPLMRTVYLLVFRGDRIQCVFEPAVSDQARRFLMWQLVSLFSIRTVSYTSRAESPFTSPVSSNEFICGTRGKNWSFPVCYAYFCVNSCPKTVFSGRQISAQREPVKKGTIQIRVKPVGFMGSRFTGADLSGSHRVPCSRARRRTRSFADGASGSSPVSAPEPVRRVRKRKPRLFRTGAGNRFKTIQEDCCNNQTSRPFARCLRFSAWSKTML